MNSRLYECSIVHRRTAPTQHRFAYSIFLMAVNLRELAGLPRKLRLFSLNRWNLYSFRPRDYLPTQSAETLLNDSIDDLRKRIEAFGEQNGANLTGCEIELVTLPRVLGYVFNPVSFYFCRTAEGQPLAAIAEVTNTFREVKPYWLGTDCFRAGAFRLRVQKHFYVSPFSDVDVSFDFALCVPGERLAVEIDDYTDGQRTLGSTLLGRSRPLSDARLAWFLIKYPAITLKVVALIHWHALRLFLKRTPWFRKSARPADQRDLFRAHSSIRPKTSS